MEKPKFTIEDKELIVSNTPKDMQKRKQWVSWRAEWNEKQNKWNKIPINPQTGKNASANQPQTWGDLDLAFWRAEKDKLAGVQYLRQLRGIDTAQFSYFGIDVLN